MDDFGVGYSSLSYLRHFEVDCLKIDRSFVSEVTRSARDRAVAAAIVQLAGSLGISVVAEGVETDAQAAFFTEANCDELQGFLFCKPQPAEQIGRYLGQARAPQPTHGASAAMAEPVERSV
jgi:EAL domain-containing protein (putative c-di-GMP-specific phosphodiesterase class I)